MRVRIIGSAAGGGADGAVAVPLRESAARGGTDDPDAHEWTVSDHMAATGRDLSPRGPMRKLEKKPSYRVYR